MCSSIRQLRESMLGLTEMHKDLSSVLIDKEKVIKDLQEVQLAHEAEVKANASEQEKTLMELQLSKVNIIFVQQSLLL